MPRTSAIIAAKRRQSTDFAIVVSFDVKEAAVAARLPSAKPGSVRTFDAWAGRTSAH
jgi:hypothetical protein